MGWLRLRQICLAAPHVELCTQALQALLDVSECHRDPAVAAYGLENILFPIGADRFLEVVCPTAPGAETAAGRFLQTSRGRGGYMLIFDCDDPAARAAHATEAGVRLAHHIDHDHYQGYQLHPRDCRACFLEFDHTKGGEDPSAAYAPAGPGWQAHIRTRTTKALLGVEILSPDPAELAAHWSHLLQIPAQPRADGAWTLQVEAQQIAILPAPGLERERLDALRLSVEGAAEILARARYLGFETSEDAFRLAGMRFRLIEA